MKVFDFSDGVKGRELASIKLPTACYGWFFSDTEKGATIGRYTFQQGVGSSFNGKPFTVFQMDEIAPLFGVEAVCFCMGEWTCGDSTEWVWHYTATREWLEDNDKIEQIFLP